MDRDEFNRMWRIVDQSLTAHSVLRDSYTRREKVFVLLVLALSIVATAFAFVPGIKVVRIGSLHAQLATWLGILTMIIFFLALFDLVVDWRERSRRHADAASRLSDLKGKLRSAVVKGGEVTSDADLVGEYERTMAALTPLSDRQFMVMKAKHHRKVAVSKLIDSRPGAPLPLIRLLVLWQGRTGSPETTDGHDPIEESPISNGD